MNIKEIRVSQIMDIFKDADYKILNSLSQNELDYTFVTYYLSEHDTFCDAMNYTQHNKPITVEKIIEKLIILWNKLGRKDDDKKQKTWKKNKFWE